MILASFDQTVCQSMEGNIGQEADPELDAQLILLAATNHELESLRTLLRKGSANVQDPDTGYTPLHSAIAACGPSPSPSSTAANGASLPTAPKNGHGGDRKSNGTGFTNHPDEMEAAAKTMRLLLHNGAIWNDLDKNNETPGCMARRLDLTELYEIMVDAGVRAEMLLNRLDGYELLGNEEDEEDEEGEEDMEDKGRYNTTSGGGNTQGNSIEAVATAEGTPSENISPPNPSGVNSAEVNSEDFLRSNLTFSSDRLLDEDKNGVMMAWESGIMQRSADLLVPTDGLRILNIGHGMGIIDGFFQTKAPSTHHIIEAHPTVLAQMKENGWQEKPNVVIHEGKWQDVVPKLIEEGTLFDAIYFDTFAEDYKTLREFFSEYVIGLLDDGGIWGFFHGLGADRQVCYDVYTNVLGMDLLEAGYDVDWETLTVPDLEKAEEWKGVRRSYFALDKYKLPVCTFIG